MKKHFISIVCLMCAVMVVASVARAQDSDMKKHGNSRLDLSGTYWKPEKILKTFREFGVTEFTFSSTWSSAIQVAWAFTQMGCTLEGMIEIYGSGRKLMSNEYEKVPAFLFSL